jgi:hypothetical protein
VPRFTHVHKEQAADSTVFLHDLHTQLAMLTVGMALGAVGIDLVMLRLSDWWEEVRCMVMVVILMTTSSGRFGAGCSGREEEAEGGGWGGGAFAGDGDSRRV